MEDKGEVARRYFYEGYNCAQSVLLTFAEECGLSQKMAARIGASLGGGMGRLREVCGTLSAIFVLDGLLEGYDQPGDIEGKAVHYARIQELAAEFREKNGSIICRDLLGLGSGADSPVPEVRDAAYYQRRPCGEMCACAARIFQKHLSSQD